MIDPRFGISAKEMTLKTMRIMCKNARSIGELIDAARTIATEWQKSGDDRQELWYRGISQETFDLLPTLYRPKTVALDYDEIDIFERFRNLASPHLYRPFDAKNHEWEWYFLARHFNLPSRLLDWTENLLIGAFFALHEKFREMPRSKVNPKTSKRKVKAVFDDSCPAVWMMDAGSLNMVTQGLDAPFFVGGLRTKGYLPDEIYGPDGMRCRFPAAILPPRSNNRICAQQGVFTIHGTEKISLQKVASNFPEMRLATIRLDRANLFHFWEEIWLAGINRFALFPDLEAASWYVQYIAAGGKTPS